MDLNPQLRVPICDRSGAPMGALTDWMSEMRNRLSIAALALILLGLPAAPLHAQGSEGFPFSIINDGSERRAAKRGRKAPPPAQVRPAAKETAKTTPRRARRGSSTLSAIPTHRSPLTPLGQVRPMPTAPSMANPASPAAPVPGISGVGGAPAIAPSRPAGQTFQDRTTTCIMSGTGQGVGAGQIGSFTQSCVNR
jgi:hypothetical protein